MVKKINGDLSDNLNGQRGRKNRTDDDDNNKKNTKINEGKRNL